MNLHFITFANTSSNFSTDRIIFEAKEIGVFDTVTCYSEKDFDDEYIKKYGSHFNGTRGYGYWSWKPYFLKKKFSEINDGDVVVYADCGCMFLYENKNTLLKWADITAKSDSGILSPCYGPYIEHDWTRGDLYEYVNKTYNKDNVDIFDKAIQCGCGVSLYCKKEKCSRFLEDWNYIMTNHFDLCTDAPSSIPNHPNFKENRHDQSVFSMLSKIYNIEVIKTEDGILNKNSSPIIAARCKNDKYSWKKPVKILFDSQIYDLQRFGGISRMYVDIHNSINTNEIAENYTGSGIARGRYQEMLSKFSVSETKNIYLSNTKPYSYGEGNNKELSIKMIEEGDYDIFYPTFFSPYFLKYLNGKPFIMSVHDMIPELYPQFFSKNDPQIIGKRELVKYASAIEVPTETTKNDLIRILNVDSSKVYVVGRGIDKNFGNNALNESIVDGKYVLYVGQRNAYKRFDWFIKHSAPFFKKHQVKLVCTGNDFNKKEKDLLNEYGMSDNTIVMKPNDAELVTLYKNALFFVYPSEYEGFGIPILEAYKMGCIALLNSNECFKEVTFGKGTFFDLKENESNIVEVMEKTLELTKAKREEILKTQYEILSNYSNEKMVSNIKDIIKKVLTKKQDLKIYVCTHKEFEPIVHSNVYEIVNANDINDDTAPNGLKGSFYSELMTYKYIAENFKLPKYVGFCCYRKYFSFLDDIPDIDKIFSEYDAIAAKPKILRTSVKTQYSISHNIEDLYIISGIIAEKYLEQAKMWKSFINSNILIPYNMFIMKREDFKEYIDFIFSILDEYLKIVGTDINKRIYDNYEKYIKKFYPNNTVEYQYRIGGYIAERCTNIFMMYKFKKIKTYPVIVTEDKYKNEKSISNL